MEFIYLTDEPGNTAGIIIQGDTVRVVSPSFIQATYTVKEFDRFVSAYRKARRESKAVPETKAEPEADANP